MKKKLKKATITANGKEVFSHEYEEKPKRLMFDTNFDLKELKTKIKELEAKFNAQGRQSDLQNVTINYYNGDVFCLSFSHYFSKAIKTQSYQDYKENN